MLNILRTISEHSVCDMPERLNYYCSTGGQIPKMTSDSPEISGVGLLMSSRDGERRVLGWKIKPESTSQRSRVWTSNGAPQLTLMYGLGQINLGLLAPCLYSRNNHNN